MLLAAARDLFSRQDYRRTTTREIAEAAGVSEYLLFRHFGSKAGLFREALVSPFTTFVESFSQTWQAVVPEETDEEQTFQIVGEDEADIKDGRLSVTSPLARALIGKGKGDSVEVSTPRGNKSYEVVTVAFG